MKNAESFIVEAKPCSLFKDVIAAGRCTLLPRLLILVRLHLHPTSAEICGVAEALQHERTPSVAVLRADRRCHSMGCASSKQSRRSSERESPQWDGHIRPVRAWKLERPISTEHLARLRNEFWETRVEGRPEMWQALRFAAESQSVSSHPPTPHRVLTRCTCVRHKLRFLTQVLFGRTS